jgi:CRP/FNR family transcriptional regulator
LSKFHQSGLIAVDHKHIRINDIHKLKEMVSGCSHQAH